MRRAGWICALSVLGWTGRAQSPAGATLSLGTHHGRTQFRMGEQIDVELRFTASVPGRYRVNHAQIDRRYARQPETDWFSAEPRASAVDPLLDSGTLFSGGLARQFMPLALGSSPLVVPGIVNDWVSFRKPGRYRVTAESTRVLGADGKPVPLRSNTVEIEIVAPEPGWRERRLREAVAVLEKGGDDEALRQAARTLRYLETVEAVRPMARFFERGPQAAQQDLHAALTGSPHRDEVIAALEQSVTAPGVAVTNYYIGALMQIEYSRRFGPREAPLRDDPESFKRWMEADRAYMDRFKPIHDQYLAMLAEALPRKQAEARGVCLETLFAEGDQPPSPAIRKALVEGFVNFPDALQARLLTRWAQLAGPDMEPVLQTVAGKPGAARDAALQHLIELNPAAARPIILARIRAGDVEDARPFLFLPEETLPELDDALVAQLAKGPQTPLLIARYASAAALPRVRAWLERNPHAFCFSAIPAYLYRVDANLAADLQRRIRPGQPGCALQMPQYAARLLMSPGLERAIIDDLSNPDIGVQRSAQMLLQYGGSAAAEQPLWDGFARLRESPRTPLDEGLEFGYQDALMKGFGWVLTPEKMDALERACISNRCREFARSERRWLDSPIRISVLPDGPWNLMIGPTPVFTDAQIREKLRQFPRGAVFGLPEYPAMKANWFWRQRLTEIRRLLTESGMSAVPVK